LEGKEDPKAYLEALKGFACAYVNLLKSLFEIGTENYFDKYNLATIVNDSKTQLYGKLKSKLTANKSIITNEQVVTDQKWSELTVTPDTLNNLGKQYKHRVLASLLSNENVQGVIGYKPETDYVKDTDNWFQFVQSIKPAGGKKDDWKDVLKKATSVKVWEDFIAECNEREIWDSTKNGQIIFSEYGDSSYYFDESGTVHSYHTGLNDAEFEGKSMRAYLLSI